jgi:hypothetical protein
MLNNPTLYENRTARAHIRRGTVLTRVSPKYLSLDTGFLNHRKFLITFMIDVKAPDGLMMRRTRNAINSPRMIQINDEIKDCTPGFLKMLVVVLSLLMP